MVFGWTMSQSFWFYSIVVLATLAFASVTEQFQMAWIFATGIAAVMLMLDFMFTSSSFDMDPSYKAWKRRQDE